MPASPTSIKNYQGHEVSPSLRARELACHCFMDASWWSVQSMCVRWFGTKSSQCLAHKRCRNGRDPGELSPSNNTAMPHSGINRVVPTPLNKHSEQYIRTNETYTERRSMWRGADYSLPRKFTWSSSGLEQYRLSLFMGMNLKDQFMEKEIGQRKQWIVLFLFYSETFLLCNSVGRIKLDA